MTNPLAPSMPCDRIFSITLGLALAGLLALLPAPAAAEKVGEITLQLGAAWAIGADGVRRPLAERASVVRGETLETGAAGHLHVRFVDGGVVSVRPNSRLSIEDYRDPAAGGAVRFRLERGVVRSLTGRYGEADRGRFRLNTPIAAIGVAGTDFVVEAGPLVTRAAVFQGAIVAAPFSAECAPEGLGPCVGPLARPLSAEQAQWLIEIRPGEAPRLLPRGDLAELAAAKKAAALAVHPKEEAIAQAQAEKSLPLAPATFAWGRWPQEPAWPGDDLALPAASVAAGRERVAENARYVLYRLPQSAPLPDVGRLDLALVSAQAHLVRPDGVQSAQVRDGWLTLDFTARRFLTGLTLEAAPTGAVPFAAVGQIQPDGSFRLIEITTRVFGAYGVGGSGPTAAYLFERATPAGMFMGITSWR